MTGDIILVASRHPRAVKAEALVAEFQKHGVKPRVAESVKDAMKLALEEAGPNDLICAAGSIFVIAEVMEMMRNSKLKGQNRSHQLQVQGSGGGSGLGFVFLLMFTHDWCVNICFLFY